MRTLKSTPKIVNLIDKMALRNANMKILFNLTSILGVQGASNESLVGPLFRFLEPSGFFRNWVLVSERAVLHRS